MQLKFLFVCLWLLWSQVLAQDVRPEFPEDFPKTTTEAAPTTTTTEAEPETTTELPLTTTTRTTITTTTTEAATEMLTTERPTATTRRAPPLPSSTELPDITTRQPYPYPTFEPPTRPPHFTPAYHWLWDLYESEEEQRCYLRDQVERNRVRWSCGFTSSLPIISCYRCCYFGNSRFAGCSKLYSGRCNAENTNWQI